MTGGPDEEEARVHSHVDLLPSLGLLFLPHIYLMLVVHEIDDGGPRVTVVDIVAEAGGVNDGKLDFERFLFELRLDDFNLCRKMAWSVTSMQHFQRYDNANLGELVQLLDVSATVILRWRQLGGEKGVDEGRLAQTRFT